MADAPNNTGRRLFIPVRQSRVPHTFSRLPSRLSSSTFGRYSRHPAGASLHLRPPPVALRWAVAAPPHERRGEALVRPRGPPVGLPRHGKGPNIWWRHTAQLRFGQQPRQRWGVAYKIGVRVGAGQLFLWRVFESGGVAQRVAFGCVGHGRGYTAVTPVLLQ